MEILIVLGALWFLSKVFGGGSSQAKAKSQGYKPPKHSTYNPWGTDGGDYTPGANCGLCGGTGFKGGSECPNCLGGGINVS